MTRPAVKHERREQILEGLFEAMAREGSVGASITDIAKAAGIARGALHYYFSSKDEIRSSLMTHLGHQYASSLEGALNRALDRAPASDREALVRALVRWHFRGDEERAARLLAVWIDFWGQAPTDDRLNGVVLEVQERARGLCERALLHARPELACALDDEERRHAAAALLALVEGGLLQWRVAARTGAALDREALSQRLTDAALAFVRSLTAPPSVETA